MTARITTVTFQGIDVVKVEVQVAISSGLPALNIVGLADKAVSEAKERVRAALTALGLSLPPKRITVNLSPADLAKEGSHFDLPIALGLLAAMDVISEEELLPFIVLGELALDGRISPVTGVLPAAIHAQVEGRNILCPKPQGGEAVWAGDLDVLAPHDLLELVNHFKGRQILSRPQPTNAKSTNHNDQVDLRDIRGQESAKRALEIAAAGNHNLLLCGPPGAGKSMLARRLPGILPPLDAHEALEVSMIHSIAGTLPDGGLMTERPFRDPHHSASMPALVGGGHRVRPGEVSLAHLGVLFLDELPEYSRPALEALRQPLESGRAEIARANAHVSYPARVQLIAAMNPCRCGHLDDPALACSRAPKCAENYRDKISGPLLDRIDLHLDVPPVSPTDLHLPPAAEGTMEVKQRVFKARQIQRTRYQDHGIRTNAEADGELLLKIAEPDQAGKNLLLEATNKLKLSARGYHRVLRVARTLADLSGVEQVKGEHIAESISYRPNVIRKEKSVFAV
ncbi:YifB family Mg chelatase-like AAA ATPase [Terasakiella sp. A23]|uniref:YifB family Mg chelatase-like AAA ATPase n=1 Tax=Terasakiella sp. FCG-A23 TaxID=3080561 RepID=UPI00295374C7|nr:YifB family Mg chelatase-like AAA ATPase [Terasakiella sp. A23]MDV7338000.1 YifB family Mg chelatase-like AAA ATPase [Terasakiella sp. A23]